MLFTVTSWSLSTVFAVLGFILAFVVFFQFLTTRANSILDVQRSTWGTPQRRAFNSFQQSLNRYTNFTGPINLRAFQLSMREGDFTPDDYEELLALEENDPMKKFFNSASQHEINSLPTLTYVCPPSSSSSPTLNSPSGPSTSSIEIDKVKCVICLEDYKDGDTLKLMSCLHRFHAPCLEKWLLEKAECPLCRWSMHQPVHIDGNF